VARTAKPAPKHAPAKKTAKKHAPAKKAAAKKTAKAGRAAARTSPSRTAQRRRAPAKAKNPTGFHGRLGLLWAIATLPVLLLGPIPLALWMAAHAGLAGIQTARSHKGGKRPPPNPLGTGVGAALLALGCAIGWPGAVVGLVLATAVPVVLPGVLKTETSDPQRTVLLSVAIGAAAGSLVLARSLGAMPALVLFALMCAHDTGNYLIGSGASSTWEGPAAGVAAMGPVILGAATVAVPPFTESGVWVLGGIAAALIPLGPHAASRMVGRRVIRVPALRRLDALLLAGPVWALAATLLRR
jgi:CDP-diglyceride synthetase